MRMNYEFDGTRAPAARAFASGVASERGFFHPPMHSGLLKCLQRCSLSVSQSRFGTTLWKCPATSSCLYQQELDLAVLVAIADGCHLFVSSHLTEFRWREEAGRWLI